MEILDNKLDVLINGAGTQYRNPAADFPTDKWRLVMDINISSIFYLCQLAGREMIKQGSGKIINIASMNAFTGGIYVPAYAASKGGVMQLTKALSNE